MFFETLMSWAGSVSGVLCRYLREEGESAFLCLVSALVIQPVLLCSVMWRFVLATGCGKHLFVICIPHGVFFRNIIIIIVIIIIIIIIKTIFSCMFSNKPDEGSGNRAKTPFYN